MTATVWRRESRLWLPALVLLLANVAALGLFRVFLNDGETSRGAVERAQAEYRDLTTRRQRAEGFVIRAGNNQRRLERVYRNRFKTQEQRITKVIAEVKGLAQRAGLDPPTIHYPDDPIATFGLVKRSIVFSVDGTYQSLRKFINFLELTDSFVILEEIRPGDNAGRGQRLSIALKVSTLFLEDDVDPAELARSSRSAEARR